MDLPKVLIDQFAKVTNDEKNESQNATLYGTIKVNGGINYVQLDGSDLLTPCTTSVNIKDGERVMVVVGQHEAVVTGNMSSPAARKKDVDDVKKELGEEIDISLDAYDTKLKQMNELAANTLGFYYTEEKAADGSIISYRHDSPELSDSKIIYKTGIDGFFLSVDGGATWKAGFDKNGDAVLNILYAIGIQSKWINTTGFTATDNNGKETFKIDESTGAVYIDPSVFMLGDKTVTDTLDTMISDSSTVFLLLSNEYQAIVTDSDGNVVGDFPECTTTLTVMSGNDDVTADAVIQPSKKKGISSFSWNPDTFTYSVKGISEDDCYVEFTALYNGSTVTRRFSVCKQRYGKDGENAVSPTVSVTKKDGKTTISITDKTGTHTQTVLDGTNGTPGKPGADGKTPYFHVKYSNDGGKTFTDNFGEKSGSYIGTYTDHIEKDSTVVTDYTWVKIEGKDGVSPKITLTKSNGKTTITTVDTSGTHTQTVLDGTNGTPGINGDTSYFHLKYSNDGGRTFTSNNGEDVGEYFGTYTDFNEKDSTNVSDYTWVRIKGDAGKNGTNGKDGKNGKGISSVTTYYQANNSTSGIYTYTSGWSTSFTAPSSSAKYLWTYQVTTYNDGTSDTTTPHIIGTYGKDGKDGSSLTTAEIWDMLLNSKQDFIYKYGNTIYINASYINTGNFAGWDVDSSNGRLRATVSDFSDSGSDGTLNLKSGDTIDLNGKKGMVKTTTNQSVNHLDYVDEKSYAAMYGNTVNCGQLKANWVGSKIWFGDTATFTNNPRSPKATTGSGTTAVITSDGYIKKKSSSSFRYKCHQSFIDDEDVKKLYSLRPVWFKYKPDYLDKDSEDVDRLIPGFYAELVDKYFPEAVMHNGKGKIEDWDTKKLVPAMLKLIQLQKEQLDKQEERLSKIESLLNLKED